MSRAEASSAGAAEDVTGSGLPPAPTLRGALRAGARDFYDHVIRVVPVNVLFGVLLIAALVAWGSWGPIAAVMVGIPLAIPIAGAARLGALATRGEDVNLSDAFDPLRSRPAAVLVAWCVSLVVTVVLGVNIATGILRGDLVGISLATLAFWGLGVSFAIGFAFWPLLVDPRRADRPARAAGRLAALLVLAHPVRFGALTVLLVAILVLSTIAFAALLTISVGLVQLIACRYVLPAADRLEAHLPQGGAPG